MQKNPEAPKEAENAQAAEGELPDAKLAEVSGGGLAEQIANAGNSTESMLQMQSAMIKMNLAAKLETDLMTTVSNAASAAAKKLV